MVKQYTREHITTKQGKTENPDNNIAKWEYFLRQYVDIAIRYNFSAGTTMILDGYLKQGREKWENFKASFRKKKMSMNEIEKVNFFADLKNDFYPIANTYSEWYEKKCPYSLKSKINAYTALNEFCKDSIKEIDILSGKNNGKEIITQENAKLKSMDEPKENFCSFFIEDSFFKTNKYFETFKSLSSFTLSHKDVSYKIPVYPPQLMLIFTLRAVPGWNSDKNINENFNGRYYRDIYIEAFIKGVEYFEENFSISPNILYGPNAEKYVRDLHANYFHSGCKDKHIGWGYVERFNLNIINKTIAKEYGYYSGVVSKVKELKQAYPRLFSDFDKCVRKSVSQSQPPENITPLAAGEPTEKEPKIPIPVIALKYQYLKLASEHEGITLENRDEIASKNKWVSKTSGKQLYDDFKKFENESERVYPIINIDESGYYLSKNNIVTRLKQAIKELAAHPKALEIAKKELEKASK